MELIEVSLCMQYAYSAQVWSGCVVCGGESGEPVFSLVQQEVSDAAARNIFLYLEDFTTDSKLFKTFSHTTLNQIFISEVL